MEQQLEQLNKAVSMAETSAMGLLKSHVKQYTRSDGTVVQEHEDSRPEGHHDMSEHEKHGVAITLRGKHPHTGEDYHLTTKHKTVNDAMDHLDRERKHGFAFHGIRSLAEHESYSKTHHS